MPPRSASSLLELDLGEFDDQMAFLAARREHDQTDLPVHIEGKWRHPLDRSRAEHCDRNGQQNREGRDQLSYSAAESETQNSSEKPKIAVTETPFSATCSWNDIPW